MPKFLSIFLLIIILTIAFFLRTYFPWKSVFQNPIRYAADDGVYHMRLVENLLLGGHFPHRIYFDPFTYFPYGTYIHFGPLYDQLLAFIIWVAGLGYPTLELINKIAPFYPVILGTLAVLVVYFIGKVLWGKWVGLASSFFMAVSAPSVFRSLLGATDHHQAEVLFSSLALLFLILAISNPRGKKFLFWTILSGISFSLYFLTWNGALLFLFIIFLSLFLFYLLEYLAGRSQFWILKTGIIIFTLTLIAISFFLKHPDIFHSALYDIRHISSLLLGIVIFFITGFLGKLLEKRQTNKSFIVEKSSLLKWLRYRINSLSSGIYLLLILFILGLLSFLIIKLYFPFLFSALLRAFRGVNLGMVNHPLARQIVSEMAPLTISGAFETFSCLFYLSFLVLFFLIWKFIKERKPEDLLLIIWFLMIVFISGAITPYIGQRRFGYYLAVNISLFSGFLFVKGLELAKKWLLLWRQQKKEKNAPFLLAGSLLLIFNLFHFVFYPFPLNLIENFPYNLPKIFINALDVSQNGVITLSDDWYETLKWLREKTPDPGLDYYQLYPEPPFNPNTGKIYPYPYPQTAYGVLASWDFGHAITYYAHRLPIANPFQQGLGRFKKEKEEPGETTFFLETDEEKASQILSQLKVRYIITDFEGSFAYSAFPTKVKWAQGDLGGYYFKEGNELVPTDKYDKTMIVRLHLLDGREFMIEGQSESEIPLLHHFRLVYESKTSVGPSLFGKENDDVKSVKIFEYVNGAKIIGKAPSGTKVEISTKIKTNQNREFLWKETVLAKDNHFEFIVPYSTFGKDGWLNDGTKFEVFAQPYKIKIGNIEREISVSEEDIIQGNEIYI